LKARRAGIFVEIRINGFSSSIRNDIIGWSSSFSLCGIVRVSDTLEPQGFNQIPRQRRKDAGEESFFGGLAAVTV
jgi:hypothetical protein